MKVENFEIKSSEVQEVLEQSPTWIIRWGITFFFVIVAFLITGSWFFRYPQVLKAPVVITTENPPASVVARANGKLAVILIADKQEVKAGQYLACIENPFDFYDYLKAKTLLDRIQKSSRSDDSASPGMNKSTADVRVNLQQVYSGLNKQIMDTDFTRLGLQQAGIKPIEQENEQQSQYYNLKNQIHQFEYNYVLKSPVDGKVAFMKYWSTNQTVTGGDIIFTIIPSNPGSLIGKVKLPIERSGEVKAGLKVIIKLDNYPYREYGSVKGMVMAISPIPSDNTYITEISLENGLTTNYGKKLDFSQEMTGTAEIVTKDMRLIERLIQPIRYIIKRNL